MEAGHYTTPLRCQGFDLALKLTTMIDLDSARRDRPPPESTRYLHPRPILLASEGIARVRIDLDRRSQSDFTDQNFIPKAGPPYSNPSTAASKCWGFGFSASIEEDKVRLRWCISSSSDPDRQGAMG
ncbi:uncharacterized protein PAN0_010c4147 [Moesziomyces antarcticus]|uniref:Uncharacterized protein n=1 Tax=Pseudozyma antarctica TaxID=84753 RepID=A0A081CGX9_PSEA2|nr:uncharacterized protein PAN0_010c4147 [Moesziomyces antarcticus]GAK65925.1 hypothetical protein PAN0_010c4147 [Moesziomyces antarcticus]